MQPCNHAREQFQGTLQHRGAPAARAGPSARRASQRRGVGRARSARTHSTSAASGARGAPSTSVPSATYLSGTAPAQTSPTLGARLQHALFLSTKTTMRGAQPGRGSAQPQKQRPMACQQLHVPDSAQPTWARHQRCLHQWACGSSRTLQVQPVGQGR